MSAYSEYFLNSSVSVVELELVELSHPNFTTTYRFVRNARQGVTVTLEDASEAFFSYRPMRVRRQSINSELDNGIEIEIGDPGSTFHAEFDSVVAADGFQTKPTMKFRLYRSDDLSAPLVGPITLEVREFGMTADGAAFTALPPRANVRAVGELYTFDRFPGLEGFR